MNCKNCNEVLENDALFCDNCGAKVIKQRISFKFLMSELFAAMGFESLYFNTLKKMITAPHEVISEYLNGVRKRYVNPFAFLAVGTALSLIIFNFFSDEYVAFQKSINENQIKNIESLAERDLSLEKNLTTKELNKLKRQQVIAKKQLSFFDKWPRFYIKYFNIMVFLFLPLYAFLSKMTYYKPNNYGEHIVSNSYIQGISMYITSLGFLLGLIFHPHFFTSSVFFVILYYLYVFSKLYNYNLKKSFTKFLRFLMILILIFVPILILLIIVASIVLAMSNPELFKPS